MYPAQKCVGGTAMSLYPAYFLVLSVPEGQYGRKFEKIGACRANLPLIMANTEITHRVTVFLVVLALRVTNMGCRTCEDTNYCSWDSEDIKLDY